MRSRQESCSGAQAAVVDVDVDANVDAEVHVEEEEEEKEEEEEGIVLCVAAVKASLTRSTRLTHRRPSTRCAGTWLRNNSDNSAHEKPGWSGSCW